MDGKQISNFEKQAQTCDACKLKHQKCNGVRPTCHQCQCRGLHCTYSTIRKHKTNHSGARRQGLGSRTRPPSPSSPKVGTFEAEKSAEKAQDYDIVRRRLMSELVCPPTSFAR